MVWAILGSYLLFGSLGWFGGWVLSGTLLRNRTAIAKERYNLGLRKRKA